MHSGLLIDAGDLPDEVTQYSQRLPVSSRSSAAQSVRLDDNERAHIITTLSALDGNLRQAARQMGLSRAGLYNKLKKYQISVDDFRRQSLSGSPR